jgi:outer membrane protein TolC
MDVRTVVRDALGTLRTARVGALALAAAAFLALPGAGAETPEEDAAGQSTLSPAAEATYRDLLEGARERGRYSVLSRDEASTATRQWREEMARSVEGSPHADMTLPRAIALALEHSLSLENSARSVLKAASTYRAEKAQFLPFVDLVANAMYSDSKAADSKADAGPVVKKVKSKVKSFDFGGGFNATQNLPTGGQITASGDVTKRRDVTERRDGPDSKVVDYAAGADMGFVQPLLRGGGFNIGLAGVRQDRLGEIQAELSDHIRRRDVALDVISRFFQIAIALSNIEVSLKALEVKEKFIRDTETLYETGWAIPNEVTKAEIQYSVEKLRFLGLEQELKNRTEDLLEVMGLPLTTLISFRQISGNVVDSALAGVPDRETAISEALANRPELLLEDVAIRGSEIALEVAKNNTLPNVDFSASYTDREVSPDLARALDLNDHRTWSAGVSVAIPLQQVGRKETSRRAALDVETAKTDRVMTERSIINVIDGLLRQLANSEQNIDLLKKRVEDAEFNFRQESELFIYGERTSNQVSEAQDSFFEAQSNYNREILTYQTAIAQVYRALGRPLY